MTASQILKSAYFFYWDSIGCSLIICESMSPPEFAKPHFQKIAIIRFSVTAPFKDFSITCGLQNSKLDRRQMRFLLPLIKCWRLLPASDYCRVLFRCLNCAQRFDYCALGNSHMLGRAEENLIDNFFFIS